MSQGIDNNPLYSKRPNDWNNEYTDKDKVAQSADFERDDTLHYSNSPGNAQPLIDPSRAVEDRFATVNTLLGASATEAKKPQLTPDTIDDIRG